MSISDNFWNRFKFYATGESGGNEEPIVKAQEVDDEEDHENEEDEEEESPEKKGDDKEDEEELVLSRVNYKDVKEKHPTFFKDFPELKHAFFREQQFTEIFPTVEEAKKAAEAQSAYEEITDAVIDGNAVKFLDELRNENPQGLETFSTNFLPALEKTNRDLYFNVVAPHVRGFVKKVFNVGMQNKDENVQNAAKVVHKALFGGDYNDVERNDTESGGNNKDSSVEEDKKRYFAGKYQTLYSEVTNSCYSKLDEEINRGLSDLEKENKGLKRLLATDIRTKVLQEMDKDEAYLSRMQSLWRREQRLGFPGQLKTSFQTTFIAKAKSLIPKIRSEARKEALGKADNNSNNKQEPTRFSGGKITNKSGKGLTKEYVKEKGLTAKQIFDA
jgi:hypothetical protein